MTFAYPGSERPVLEGFDLTIPAGSSLAIVGQNGAGKTTLAKLLCRLYDPTSGAIEVDGVDLRELDLDALAGARSPPCSRTSSASSCRCATTSRPGGAPDERGARRARAGRRRRAWPTSTQPLAKGYAGGTDLSGGQWQRVALARALCAVQLGAGVVLLDEPTAQLDVRGEAEIFERILAATRHCTTILVSHRFSTVRQADRICVLEAGRVVELGTHDELMAAGGRYRTMFDLQAQRFVAAPEDEGVELDVLVTARTRRRAAAGAVARCGGCSSSATGTSRACSWSPSASRSLAALPDALFALWLKLLGRGRARRRPRLDPRRGRLGARRRRPRSLLVPAHRRRRGCSAASATGSTIALESHVARLQASVATIAHQERPELPRPPVGAARPGLRARPHVHVAVLARSAGSCASSSRSALLVVDPPGARCCSPLFAVPTVRRRRPGGPRVERAAEEAGAAGKRLAAHLFTLATTAPPGKEVRVTGIGPRLVGAPARGVGGLVRPGGPRPLAHRPCGTSLGWALFGAGLRRRGRVRRRRASTARRATCCSCWPPARGLSAYVGATVGEIGFLRGIWMDGARRLAWLEDYAAALVADADVPVPERARATASRSSTCRSPTRAPTGSCSRTCRSTCPPARWWPSSARTAPARPRS